MDSVSIVIPCYNPGDFLLEAVASARAQDGCSVELVLVNDGTDNPKSQQVLSKVRPLVDQYVEQANGGLASARNSGFHAASSSVIIPLDADDLLDPRYATSALRILSIYGEAAFAYSDFRVFGTENYVEQPGPYNLYNLLDRNYLTYAAAIRRKDWERIGGYDESMVNGYEDWEFWLRLGSAGRYGQHFSGELFRYRKHGPSLLDRARAHHQEITDYIQKKHPNLYRYEARARIKQRWLPAVCIVAPASQAGIQTIVDCVCSTPSEACTVSSEALLIPQSGQALRHDSAEMAALAVWGGHSKLELADGSVAMSRRAFAGNAANLTVDAVEKSKPHETGPSSRLMKHLSNAGLLSGQAWMRHPLRSTTRLLPLRVKERVNQVLGRQLFDLSFYLQFQPAAIQLAGAIQTPLRYCPQPSTRKRIAFLTPHLGAGGAERVLLDVASSLDRTRVEILLLATQSSDDRWRERWEDAVDHVYDLQKLAGFERAGAAIYSIVANWSVDTLLVQNSLTGYAILPQLKAAFSSLRTLDLIHSVDSEWNILNATQTVSDAIDVRVAISETVQTKLRELGIPPAKLRLIRAGVELDRFSNPPAPIAGDIHRILFAGRLDAVKRPLLLTDIALELRRRRGKEDFLFIVAGDGPEFDSLQARIRKQQLNGLFELRGQVKEIAPLFGQCELLVLPSSAEGIPLVILEAFASGRTVVASAVGGVSEVVTADTGVVVNLGPREIEDFAQAINCYLDQPELRGAHGRNGRRLIEESFTRERFVAAYRELLDRQPS